MKRTVTVTTGEAPKDVSRSSIIGIVTGSASGLEDRDLTTMSAVANLAIKRMTAAAKKQNATLIYGVPGSVLAVLVTGTAVK